MSDRQTDDASFDRRRRAAGTPPFPVGLQIRGLAARSTQDQPRPLSAVPAKARPTLPFFYDLTPRSLPSYRRKQALVPLHNVNSNGPMGVAGSSREQEQLVPLFYDSERGTPRSIPPRTGMRRASAPSPEPAVSDAGSDRRRAPLRPSGSYDQRGSHSQPAKQPTLPTRVEEPGRRSFSPPRSNSRTR